MTPKGSRGPRPAALTAYYARLTQIFGRSESRLYAAYAWYRCVGGVLHTARAGQGTACRVGGVPSRG